MISHSNGYRYFLSNECIWFGLTGGILYIFTYITHLQNNCWFNIFPTNPSLCNITIIWHRRAKISCPFPHPVVCSWAHGNVFSASLWIQVFMYFNLGHFKPDVCLYILHSSHTHVWTCSGHALIQASCSHKKAWRKNRNRNLMKYRLNRNWCTWPPSGRISQLSMVGETALFYGLESALDRGKRGRGDHLFTYLIPWFGM